jgi:hypothetical protein
MRAGCFVTYIIYQFDRIYRKAVPYSGIIGECGSKSELYIIVGEISCVIRSLALLNSPIRLYNTYMRIQGIRF